MNRLKSETFDIRLASEDALKRILKCDAQQITNIFVMTSNQPMNFKHSAINLITISLVAKFAYINNVRQRSNRMKNTQKISSIIWLPYICYSVRSIYMYRVRGACNAPSIGIGECSFRISQINLFYY